MTATVHETPTGPAPRPRHPADLRGVYRLPAASCISDTVDPEWFFAPRGTPEQQAARALCRRCPVQDACAAYALDADISHGVFGGHDEHDRALTLQAMRSRRMPS